MLKEITMNTTQARRDRIRREQRGVTNRRSLLALVAVGLGALASRPAESHHAVAPSDALPASTSTRAINIAERNAFPELKKVGAERQVRTIQHRGGSYRVVTADGNDFDFSESDLRFKVDSSALGPAAGRPVIMSAGEVGDRASVFFAAPDEISAFIKHQS
jgi:cytochrome c